VEFSRQDRPGGDPSLWETIEKALADSEYFLLMGISGSGRLALGPERGRLVARQLLSEQHAYPVDGWRDRVLSPGQGCRSVRFEEISFCEARFGFSHCAREKVALGFSGCRRGCWIGRRGYKRMGHSTLAPTSLDGPFVAWLISAGLDSISRRSCDIRRRTAWI